MNDPDFKSLRIEKIEEDALHLKGKLGYGPESPQSEIEIEMPQ